MPELSRFYGIVIKMYFDDHDPSHFHAEDAEDEAVISIETLAIIAAACGRGRWASCRSGRTAWLEAKNLKPIGKIAPLP